jgi:hypothetical protein
MGYRIVVQNSTGAERVHMTHTIGELNTYLAELGSVAVVEHGTPSGATVVPNLEPTAESTMALVYWTVVKDAVVSMWRAARQYEDFGDALCDNAFGKGQAAGYRAASVRIDALITQHLSEA